MLRAETVEKQIEHFKALYVTKNNFGALIGVAKFSASNK
jgi:hypothetical protein